MTTVTKYTTLNAAGAEVNARAERHVAAKGGSYLDAVHTVLTGDPEIKAAYAASAVRVTPRRLRPRPQAPAAVKMVQGNAAGEALHTRVEALLEEHPRLGYRDAMRMVLDADADLKARYAGVQS